MSRTEFVHTLVHFISAVVIDVLKKLTWSCNKLDLCAPCSLPLSPRLLTVSSCKWDVSDSPSLSPANPDVLLTALARLVAVLLICKVNRWIVMLALGDIFRKHIPLSSTTVPVHANDGAVWFAMSPTAVLCGRI